MDQTNAKQNATIKLGCRFTPAEAELLDTLSTALGISTSSYFRLAVKEKMLEDLLKRTGHHSNVRTEADVSKADQKLTKLIENLHRKDSD